MENKSLKILKKINIIDILILVSILLILIFFISKIKNNKIVNYSNGTTFIMKFYAEEVNNFVAKNIEIGDIVLDDTKNLNLGKVTNLKIKDSIDFNPNYLGKLVSSSKEDYNSIEITTELKAQKFEHGILVNNNRYSIGHSITIRAGKTILFLRISDIKEKNSTNNNLKEENKIKNKAK